jgi:hypothetical protein
MIDIEKLQRYLELINQIKDLANSEETFSFTFEGIKYSLTTEYQNGTNEYRYDSSEPQEYTVTVKISPNKD